MQINVIEYFENGALRKCREKVAVHDQGRDYTFAEIERFDSLDGTRVFVTHDGRAHGVG